LKNPDPDSGGQKVKNFYVDSAGCSFLRVIKTLDSELDPDPQLEKMLDPDPH
jgi:hypothetical protein